MPHSSLSRRTFLTATAGSVCCWNQFHQTLCAGEKQPRHIATNTYPWRTFAQRAKTPYARHTDALLTNISSTGIPGYEPIVDTPGELAGLGERLRKHKLEMRSIYVNSVLHDKSQAENSTAKVLAIAKTARQLGTSIVVTNPSPIHWGGAEDKTDAQLRFQAGALDRLGAELRKLGITLAYHNHDAELRQGGREFHHMLTATDPENVKFCLDAHWIFRGCGNSEVAVMDAVSHYHNRIVELHLRQSTSGVWTEAFTMQGDINYTQILEFLTRKNITPHLVLEQAVEAKSPVKLNAPQAHQMGYKNLKAAIG